MYGGHTEYNREEKRAFVCFTLPSMMQNQPSLAFFHASNITHPRAYRQDKTRHTHTHMTPRQQVIDETISRKVSREVKTEQREKGKEKEKQEENSSIQKRFHGAKKITSLQPATRISRK